jgi:hypothetical protein
MIELIKRSNCCVCDSGVLAPHRTIPDFPIYMGISSSDSTNDLCVDQEWSTCDFCGTLQLSKLVPLDLLYSTNHQHEAVGPTWLRHHRKFADFIKTVKDDKVCEIGSAHDYLAGILLDENPSLDFLSVEPDSTNPDRRISHIKGYAEDHISEIAQKRVIIHSHVLEHVYSPKKFIESLATAMTKDSVMFVSFPNIEELLIQKGTNALNFEHSYFLTPEVFSRIAEGASLRIVRQEKFEKHSYFVELQKFDNQASNGNFRSFQETRLFDDLWEDLEDFVEDTLKRISTDEVPTYLFGSHIFSQALFTQGLHKARILGVLDNAQNKQGSRLYGTNLFTYSPDVIRKLTEVRVILRASHYQEEIREQLQEINPKVEIIE